MREGKGRGGSERGREGRREEEGRYHCVCLLTFHISMSSSSTLEPGNMGRPQAISKKIQPTPL